MNTFNLDVGKSDLRCLNDFVNQKLHGLPDVGQIEFLSLSTQIIQRSVDFFAHLPAGEIMPLPFCGLHG